MYGVVAMNNTDIFLLQVAAILVGALVGAGIVLAGYFLGERFGLW
jgi:hypothetical protein